LLGKPIELKAGKVSESDFMVILPKDSLKSSNTKIVIGIYSSNKMITDYTSTFVGPNKLDKK
jgi:hypothetical protein